MDLGQSISEKGISEKPEKKSGKTISEKAIAGVLLAMVIAVVAVIGFNAYQISQLRSVGGAIRPAELVNNPTPVVPITGKTTAGGSIAGEASVALDILPKGTPPYGKELGVSFDDISINNQQKADATLKKLGLLDQQITLEGEELERYIAIASQISCEYCCGVEAIIFDNGKPACGCMHSFAMRGLAKYLIKNHGSEYSDDAVLEELSKWKTLFFPGQMAKKAEVLKQKGIAVNYINLASNKYRGIEG